PRRLCQVVARSKCLTCLLQAPQRHFLQTPTPSCRAKPRLVQRGVDKDPWHNSDRLTQTKIRSSYFEPNLSRSQMAESSCASRMVLRLRCRAIDFPVLPVRRLRSFRTGSYRPRGRWSIGPNSTRTSPFLASSRWQFAAPCPVRHVAPHTQHALNQSFSPLRPATS